jgi:hypothetical protein
MGDIGPTSWQTTHILPLHKKGTKQARENCRPIAIEDIIAKIYATILLPRSETR